MRTIAIIWALVVLPAALAAQSRPAGQPTKFLTISNDSLTGLADAFEARRFNTADGTVLPYRFFKPAAQAGEKYPLVIFFCGSGATRSDDNVKQYSNENLLGARLWALPENQKKHPCFIIAPQWSDKVFAKDKHGSWREAYAAIMMDLLKQIMKEQPVDPDRIYVTGLSMGGSCAWNMIQRHPETFAAAVPICGTGDPTQVAGIVKNRIAVWIFHGAIDSSVPVAKSQAMSQALTRAGANVKYTEYPKVNHNAWDYAYKEPQLVEWLFSQKRSNPSSAPASRPSRPVNP